MNRHHLNALLGLLAGVITAPLAACVTFTGGAK